MIETIIEILKSTERPGIDNLITYMLGEGEFFKASCSSQYHLCKEGGLAEHSMNVYQFAYELYATHGMVEHDITSDEIAIAALLHDIGKASYRGKPNYVPNFLSSGKLSTNKPFETNKEKLYIAHEIISLQIINKFIELTEEEEFAILYHNGMYVATGRDINGKERPLQQLLHFSDMWCSRFIEKDVR